MLLARALRRPPQLAQLAQPLASSLNRPFLRLNTSSRLFCNAAAHTAAPSNRSRHDPARTQAAAAAAAAVTSRQLRLQMLAAAVPMVGFGFMDNIIMIQAGDLIDTYLGDVLGLSTMTAAGFGQVCSDASGVLFGGTIEAVALRLGLEAPNLTSEQLDTGYARFSTNFGACVGVVIGCLLGMTSLLFMDLDKNERLRRQAELAPLFQSMVRTGSSTLLAERSALWVLDPDGKHLYSKTRFKAQAVPGPDRQALRETFDAYDRAGSGLISSEEIGQALHTLGNTQLKGFNVREQIHDLLTHMDFPLGHEGQLDFAQFVNVMDELLRGDEMRIRIRDGGFKARAIATKHMVTENNVADTFHRSQDSLTGSRTNSVMVMPIVNNEHKVIALLEVVNKRVSASSADLDARGFTAEDEQLLQMLCDHATIFIEKVSKGLH